MLDGFGVRWCSLALWVLLLAACGAEGEDNPAPDDVQEQQDTRGDAHDPSPDVDAPPDADVAVDAPDADPVGPPPSDALFCLAWDGMLQDRPSASPPADCRPLAGRARFHCAEHWFWIALSDELALRRDADRRLTEVIELLDTPGSGFDEDTRLGLSRLYALRGQLRMAKLVEHGRFDLLTAMRADFQRVTELDPENPIIPSFADSLDMILAYNTGDTAALEAMEPRIWANVERCPLGNLLSISGIALGLPLSTGWPQAIAESLTAWSCHGADFCTQNTWKAPYARPGLAYHFGETYARVGDGARARTYFEDALRAEGAAAWPYRRFVEQTLGDLDAYLADFAALGDDQGAGPLTYAGQTFGCVFCHTHDPPEGLVPDNRLGRHTLMQPFDDGGPDPVDPVDPVDPGPGNGACDNAADLGILGSNTDIGSTVGNCATGCLGRGEPCITACMEERSGLSSGCSACFGAVGQCTIDRCALQCISPSSAGCQTCQRNNCLPAFERCAGMAMP